MQMGQRLEWREDRGEDHDHIYCPNQDLEDEQPLVRPIGEEQVVLVEAARARAYIPAARTLDTRSTPSTRRAMRVDREHRDAVGRGHMPAVPASIGEGPAADRRRAVRWPRHHGQFFRPMLQEGVDDDRVAERVENRARAPGYEDDGEEGAGSSGCGSPSRPDTILATWRYRPPDLEPLLRGPRQPTNGLSES